MKAILQLSLDTVMISSPFGWTTHFPLYHPFYSCSHREPYFPLFHPFCSCSHGTSLPPIPPFLLMLTQNLTSPYSTLSTHAHTESISQGHAKSDIPQCESFMSFCTKSDIPQCESFMSFCRQLYPLKGEGLKYITLNLSSTLWTTLM